ncbi:MAG: ATP-binding protein [candidate division WOR-3 bacterium]
MNRLLLRNLLYSHLVIAGLLAGLFLLVSYFILKAGYYPGLITGIILIVLASLTSVLISFLLISKRLNRSATEIEHACDRLGSGHFDVQIVLSRPDEFTNLVAAFNRMAAEINRVVTNLKQKEQWLGAIMDSLHDGLLVLDSTGRILLANNAFKRITNTTDAEGKFYWEAVREPRLAQMAQQLGTANPALTGEIELNSRTFLCSASFLAGPRQSVFTFHDITEIVQTARMKRDFILNVSHELRTPLAAIKGYVETMEETIDETNRRYLEAIRRHTDRLANLTRDLLVLSTLEDKNFELKPEDVDLREIAANALALFAETAKKKGLKLELRSAEDLPIIRADPFWLEQVLINLLDNAVKFTETGSVILSLELADGWFAISVQDTGIGIAPEHLGAIFERFYVVDKSRSRQSGGTGLGLAIVKHIIRLHNGEVTVTSTPGIGSRFTVRLPILSG